MSIEKVYALNLKIRALEEERYDLIEVEANKTSRQNFNEEYKKYECEQILYALGRTGKKEQK